MQLAALHSGLWRTSSLCKSRATLFSLHSKCKRIDFQTKTEVVEAWKEIRPHFHTFNSRVTWSSATREGTLDWKSGPVAIEVLSLPASSLSRCNLEQPMCPSPCHWTTSHQSAASACRNLVEHPCRAIPASHSRRALSFSATRRFDNSLSALSSAKRQAHQSASTAGAGIDFGHPGILGSPPQTWKRGSTELFISSSQVEHFAASRRKAHSSARASLGTKKFEPSSPSSKSAAPSIHEQCSSANLNRSLTSSEISRQWRAPPLSLHPPQRPLATNRRPRGPSPLFSLFRRRSRSKTALQNL